MAINYIEKGAGLHRYILAQGHRLWQEDGAWKSTNDAAVQPLIDSYNELADYKALRVAAIKADGLAHVQAIYPAITDFDMLLLVRDQWLSIAPAARAPTTNFTKLINTYTAGTNGISSVNAAVDKAGVDAVVVTWP